MDRGRDDFVWSLSSVHRGLSFSAGSIFGITSATVTLPNDDAMRLWMAMNTADGGEREFPAGDWVTVQSALDQVPDAAPVWMHPTVTIREDMVVLRVQEQDVDGEEVTVVLERRRIEEHLVRVDLLPVSELRSPPLPEDVHNVPKPF